MQEIFHNPIYWQDTLEEKEIKNVTLLSYDKRYDNSNSNSSLKFSPFSSNHQLILDKILKQNKDVSTYDRIEDFKNWFLNNFMEIIQNNEIKGSK